MSDAHSAHPAHLAHQFDDVHQQRQAVTLGMWAFLVTEVMLFGWLFAGYMVFKFKYTAAFMEASNLLNFKLGAINTAVLICSSLLTMVLAVQAAQVGKRKAIAGYLLATILLGCVTFSRSNISSTPRNGSTILCRAPIFSGTASRCRSMPMCFSRFTSS